MHEHELIVLLLGTLVLGLIFVYRRHLNRLPAVNWLLAAFFALWLAWVCTVLEHLFLPTFFNTLEHIGYAANGLLLLAWCWFGIKNGKVHAHD